MTATQIYFDPITHGYEFNQFNQRMITAMTEIMVMKVKLIEKFYLHKLMTQENFDTALASVELIEKVLEECSHYRNKIEANNREMLRMHQLNERLRKELNFFLPDDQ